MFNDFVLKLETNDGEKKNVGDNNKLFLYF